MANDSFNKNKFYTLSSDSDDIGTLDNIFTSESPNIIFMSFSDKLSYITISPDTSSFNVLKVNGEKSLTNYEIKFDTNPYFKKDNGSQTSTISFVNQVSSDAISNLINQLDLTKIDSSTGSADQVSLLMSDIKNLLATFPQSQFVASFRKLYENTRDELEKDEGELSKAQAIASDPTANPIDKSKASDSIDSLTPKISQLKKTISDLDKFLSPGGNSLAEALNTKIENNFNNFEAQFTSQYNFVYESLVQSGQIKGSTQRSKNSDGINQASSGTSAQPGLAVDPTNSALDAQTNLILAQNQIIPIVGISGTNLFGPHQPFDQVISILDVMRNENAGVPFTSDISVKKNITGGTDVGNDPTVCSQLYAKFSVSDINQMIKSLQNKLNTNVATASSLLVSLKRMQSGGNFQFMSAFSGFTGIDFGKLDTSNLGTFNFDGVKNAAKNAVKSVQNITVKDIGGAFGQAVSDITGAVTTQAKQLYGNTLQSMNSINFQKIFDEIDPDILRKCPSLTQIKSVMQNPDAAVSSQLSKTKDTVSQVTKSYNSNLVDLQKVSNENTAIQDQITQLQNLLKTMNP